MRKITLFVLPLLISIQIVAQNKRFSTHKQYYFNDYTNAEVFTKNNKRTELKLNYNVLLDEMNFMQGGRKLSIGNVNDIILVRFESQSFVTYKEHYYKLIYEGKSQVYSKLVPNMSVINKPAEGAYGSSSKTSSVGRISSLEERKYYQVLIAQSNLSSSEITIPVYEQFYVLKKGELTPLNMNIVYILFPKLKKQIKKFIKENELSLKKATDICKLFVFCETLKWND